MKEKIMAKDTKTRLPQVLQKHEHDLVSEWARDLVAGAGRTKSLMKEAELREQCREFLSEFIKGAQSGRFDSTSDPAWSGVRDVLTNITRTRTEQGFTPSEIGTFIFSFKKPLFTRLRKELGKDVETLGEEIQTASELLDRWGMFTTEVYQKAREGVISRQQQELLELSTPVVKLWDGVLALPLIGTLDSARTQVVMESLLQRIVETGSSMAIIDITGVPTVDTLVAQHLLKAVTAARLMGADCIISGIRPQIAQTIVHLGVALGDVTTKANLSDAFMLALQRRGYKVIAGGAPQERKA
jgi:rsbT co-antagonist protein RsbR